MRNCPLLLICLGGGSAGRQLMLVECKQSIRRPTAAAAEGSVSETYLFRCGHKVDGSVVAIILLRHAEGKLVVDDESVWSDQREKIKK